MAALRGCVPHFGRVPRARHGQSPLETGPQADRHTSSLAIHPENAIVPAPDYLCVYADLLGFSREIQSPGPDSLPDFFGAALVGAGEWPAVNVYLLSDSLLATAPVPAASELIQMVVHVTDNWRADGMFPQLAIGYGTFAERRPFREITPPNFFGIQIAGTSLIDAVNAHKIARSVPGCWFHPPRWPSFNKTHL